MRFNPSLFSFSLPGSMTMRMMIPLTFIGMLKSRAASLHLSLSLSLSPSFSFFLSLFLSFSFSHTHASLPFIQKGFRSIDFLHHHHHHRCAHHNREPPFLARFFNPLAPATQSASQHHCDAWSLLSFHGILNYIPLHKHQKRKRERGERESRRKQS